MNDPYIDEDWTRYTPTPAPAGGPPYTLYNLPPPPDDPAMEWILNPDTGEFELRPRGGQHGETPPTPPQTPPPTQTPPPYGPGVYMDPNSPPPFAAPDGAWWAFNAANGWYPSWGLGGSGGGTGGGGDPWGGGGDIFVGAPAAPEYPEYESPGEFLGPDRTPLAPFVPRRPTFALDPYQPSSWADAEQEPGYAASREQLRKQIEAGAAHRGMLRSGMTLGDLYSNLDALGQQNFRQFDERRYRNWAANQQQRLDQFDREYGMDRDIYDRYATDIGQGNAYAYQSASDAYASKAADVTARNNYRFNVADAAARDALERWKTRVSSLTTLARPVE